MKRIPFFSSRFSTLKRSMAVSGLILIAGLTATSASARERVSVAVALPHGAARVTVGGSPYWEHRGVYYQRRGDRYVIVRAPRGATVRVLPRGHTRVVIRGRTYYRVRDVYYVRRGKEYVIVEAPGATPADDPFAHEIGSESGIVRVWLDGRSYQVHDGQFFQSTPAGLVWTEAPYGAITAELPAGALTKWYQDNEYFDYEGVVFRRSPDGFKVVPAPWVS